MSVKTLKDAEIQIQLLKREVEGLKKQLVSLNAHSVPQNGSRESPQGIDSELTSDGSTVVHQLLHIFNALKAKTIDTETLTLDSLDIRGSLPHFHLSNVQSNQGFYITNLGASTYLSSGAYFNGAAWIAVNTTAVVLALHSTNGFDFFYDSGLTIGNSFATTLRVRIGTNGEYLPLTPVGVPSGGTGRNSFTAGFPLLGNAAGGIVQSPSVFSGTVFVAASSGGPVTTAKTFTNGICTS